VFYGKRKLAAVVHMLLTMLCADHRSSQLQATASDVLLLACGAYIDAVLLHCITSILAVPDCLYHKTLDALDASSCLLVLASLPMYILFYNCIARQRMYVHCCLRTMCLMILAHAATGDSLTKQWREVLPQVNGIPEVFTNYFGQYNTAILGVGGEHSHDHRTQYSNNVFHKRGGGNLTVFDCKHKKTMTCRTIQKYVATNEIACVVLPLPAAK